MVTVKYNGRCVGKMPRGRGEGNFYERDRRKDSLVESSIFIRALEIDFYKRVGDKQSVLRTMSD